VTDELPPLIGHRLVPRRGEVAQQSHFANVSQKICLRHVTFCDATRDRSSVDATSGMGRYCRKSHRKRNVELDFEANESREMDF
jgi:hypothetical protein